jgi:hypothetical protein
MGGVNRQPLIETMILPLRHQRPKLLSGLSGLSGLFGVRVAALWIIEAPRIERDRSNAGSLNTSSIGRRVPRSGVHQREDCCLDVRRKIKPGIDDLCQFGIARRASVGRCCYLSASAGAIISGWTFRNYLCFKYLRILGR